MRTHFLVLVIFLLSSCGKDEKKQTDIVTFPVKGEVVRLDVSKKRVTIAHEEIPNYMSAMTMSFKVKDSTLLAGLSVGDSVRGTLAVSRSESWLETISVSGKGEPVAERLADDIRIARLFRAGSPLPDLEFTDQDNKAIHLSDLRGKVVAMTFIYTRCPLPDYCIRMSNYFARIERALKKDPSLTNKWHLLSITFDTKHDTPEILRKYGKNYNANFADWSFVTGTEQTIRKATDGFDMIIQTSEGGLIDHNLMTALLDTKGNLVEVFDSNQWNPEDLARRMKELTKR